MFTVRMTAFRQPIKELQFETLPMARKAVSNYEKAMYPCNIAYVITYKDNLGNVSVIDNNVSENSFIKLV